MVGVDFYGEISSREGNSRAGVEAARYMEYSKKVTNQGHLGKNLLRGEVSNDDNIYLLYSLFYQLLVPTVF